MHQSKEALKRLLCDKLSQNVNPKWAKYDTEIVAYLLKGCCTTSRIRKSRKEEPSSVLNFWSARLHQKLGVLPANRTKERPIRESVREVCVPGTGPILSRGGVPFVPGTAPVCPGHRPSEDVYVYWFFSCPRSWGTFLNLERFPWKKKQGDFTKTPQIASDLKSQRPLGQITGISPKSQSWEAQIAAPNRAIHDLNLCSNHRSNRNNFHLQKVSAMSFSNC